MFRKGEKLNPLEENPEGERSEVGVGRTGWGAQAAKLF